MSSAVICFVHAIHKCVQKHLTQKWHDLAPLDRFSRLKNHSVEPDSLYGINFSTALHAGIFCAGALGK